MALSYSEKEAGIQEVIGAWQSNPGRSIADIAREFKVSPWALRRRLHRIPSKIDGSRHNKKLTPDREQAVVQHIQLLEDFRIALTLKFL
jgi:transposase-like protein